MAKKVTTKKVTTKKVSTEPTHYCEECANGEWSTKHINLNYKGEPFCIKCKFREYVVIKGTVACEKFEPKPKKINTEEE